MERGSAISAIIRTTGLRAKIWMICGSTFGISGQTLRAGAFPALAGGKMNEQPVVHSHPEIMNGEPVFIGTRVPVRALLDYLEEGDTIESFLDAFPTVSREQVISWIRRAADYTATTP
jgi:uncharacterized protein (DUF433 family)